MRKLIMFCTLLISTIAIVCITLVINRIIGVFSVLLDFTIDFSTIINLFETNIETALYSIGILALVFFQIYGIPLIVFLVSLNGLASK